MRHPVAVALASAAVAFGGASCSSVGLDAASEFDVIALESLALEAFLALLAVGAAAALPGSAWSRLGLGPGRLRCGRVALLAVGTLAASSALDGLLETFQLKDHSALGEFETLLAGVRGPSLVFGLLAFAVMPGIAEELLCRGLLQRGLVARAGPVVGIAIASLVFGALHIDPVHALFATPLGVYLGLICHLDGGIRAAVICHTANNAVALITGALLPASGAGGWPGTLASALVAIAVMAAIWHRVGGPPPPPAGLGPGHARGGSEDPAEPRKPL